MRQLGGLAGRTDIASLLSVSRLTLLAPPLTASENTSRQAIKRQSEGRHASLSRSRSRSPKKENGSQWNSTRQRNGSPHHPLIVETRVPARKHGINQSLKTLAGAADNVFLFFFSLSLSLFCCCSSFYDIM
ncbi:hypothetical protein MAP00_003903 [Monascus purpureus]|nr:hypothetical protein MAP00_003903 [Monascus purpureus]